MKRSKKLKIFGAALVVAVAALQVSGWPAARVGPQSGVVAAGDTSSDICIKHPNLPQC